MRLRNVTVPEAFHTLSLEPSFASDDLTACALEMEVLVDFSIFQQRAAQVLVALVTTIATIFWIYRVVCPHDDEGPIAFSIPRPEQCKPGWNGCTLDEPQIKVPVKSQCSLLFLT